LIGLIEHPKGLRLRQCRRGGEDQQEKGKKQGAHYILTIGICGAFSSLARIISVVWDMTTFGWMTTSRGLAGEKHNLMKALSPAALSQSICPKGKPLFRNFP
jgi:hypothetical protein